MTKISTNHIASNQAYQARGVVARVQVIGHYADGGIKKPFYKFLTLDTGIAGQPKAVEFAGFAPVISEKDGSYLDVESIPEGYVVVNPNLMYKPCLMFEWLLSQHLLAMKSYKPKIVYKPEQKREAVQLGVLDGTEKQVTRGKKFNQELGIVY